MFLFVQDLTCFNFQLEDFDLSSLTSDLSTSSKCADLQTMTQDDLVIMMSQNVQSLSHLFPEARLLVDWHPIRLLPENASFVMNLSYDPVLLCNNLDLKALRNLALKQNINLKLLQNNGCGQNKDVMNENKDVMNEKETVSLVNRLDLDENVESRTDNKADKGVNNVNENGEADVKFPITFFSIGTGYLCDKGYNYDIVFNGNGSEQEYLAHTQWHLERILTKANSGMAIVKMFAVSDLRWLVDKLNKLLPIVPVKYNYVTCYALEKEGL